MEGLGGVGFYPKPYTLNRYLYNVLEPAFSCGGYALQLRTAELTKSGFVGSEGLSGRVLGGLTCRVIPEWT